MPLLLFGMFVLAAALTVMITQTFKREVPSGESPAVATSLAPFAVHSPAFEDGAAIPAVYSCGGANINPPLRFENTPSNTKEFALIMYDANADADNRAHWIVWNIPSETTTLSENGTPAGSMTGTNDLEKVGYSGPCPTTGSGTHRYIVELYALNDTVHLPPETTRDELITAINGKVITSTTLTGTFEAPAAP